MVLPLLPPLPPPPPPPSLPPPPPPPQAASSAQHSAATNARRALIFTPGSAAFVHPHSCGGFLDEEFAHLHGVLQAALAHVGLVEKVLHHFQQYCRLVGIDDRKIQQRLGGAREDDPHHHREGV